MMTDMRFTKSILSLLAGLMIGGCAWFQSHSSTIGLIAQQAASVGTQVRLRQHPEERPVFIAAEQALTRLIDGQNWDPAAFQAALAGLPVNQLTGPNGSIYVSTFVVLWDALAQEANSVNKNATVKEVITSVRDGIRTGLADKLGPPINPSAGKAA